MILGLTGGIGSGKSTVAAIFETLGCPVFNSDLSAKQSYFDAAVRPKIIGLLGEESYLTGSTLNKPYISAKIFNNATLLKQLNEIIHPAVSVSFKSFAAKHPGKVVIKESALLFEANVQSQVDKVVTVVADDALRIKRLIKRDGLPEPELVKKINSQWSQEEKIKKSDFIIYNNETQFLTLQVLAILKKISHA